MIPGGEILPLSTQRSELAVNLEAAWRSMSRSRTLLQGGHVRVVNLLVAFTLDVFVSEPCGDHKNIWTEESFCKFKDLEACQVENLHS